MSSETTMAAELKQLPDEVYRRYGFTPAKVEVEEHHVKVYAGKKTDEIVRAPHPECLLRGSLVSRFTVKSRSFFVTACISPGRTWRTGRSSAQTGTLRSSMITCKKKMYGYHVLQVGNDLDIGK